ncbi:hypothetical protein SCG7109_AW_00040 [Chlamydiales bacterium SCGC AG-110-M15]|nr:hypothetical protein SCG7109_AW_00040 [Chlamydiales bacterium SCGC AG-110-M15]
MPSKSMHFKHPLRGCAMKLNLFAPQCCLATLTGTVGYLKDTHFVGENRMH